MDARRATAKLKQDGGAVSVVFKFNDAHLEYGVRKAVNLIHELFVDFLRQPIYFHYMVEHFDLNPDM
jgi:hypothetical protein